MHELVLVALALDWVKESGKRTEIARIRQQQKGVK